MRRHFLTVLLIFVTWRGTLFLVDFTGAALSTERARNPYKDAATYPIYEPSHYFIDGWFRWDAGWYKRIVVKGYYIEGRQSNVAFFPLYPYLARWGGAVIGNPYIAGLIISNVATLFALFYLFLLGIELMDEARARNALILLLCFPGSFFFSAFYAEGLFLAAAALSAYGYQRKRYMLCGVAGFFAALSRPTGIVLFIAFALDLAWRLFKRREKFTPWSLGLLLIPAGVVAFMIILHYQVGDPLSFLTFQAGWGRKSTFPLWTIIKELRNFNWAFPRGSEKNMDLVETVFSIAFLVIPMAMAIIRKFRPPAYLWMFVLISILISLSSGRSLAMVRHTAVCFPAFLWLADITENHPLAQRWLIYLFSCLLMLFSLRYINWYWAG